MTIDVEVDGEKKQYKIHDLEEFLVTVISDITAIKQDMAELKKSTAESVAWFNEARSGLQFLYKIGSVTSAFLLWSAKIIGAVIVVWAAIAAAKEFRLPTLK